ncbi:MAG TPA: UDP-N-acetylmuramoyl-L-alanine--D-glutamate ligase [Desulfomonilia bacterium]
MKVLVWGTGETGIEAARVMAARGNDVRLVDEIEPGEGLAFPASRLEEADIAWADLVIPSPGVPRGHPMLAMAKKVLSEIEVAASMLTGRLVAVTGTNGKTTTVTLIHRILSEAGLNAGIGGNISPPLISLVDADPEYVVSEISSFQLEWIEKFRPSIGVCMNITPDHLDRYNTMEEYVYYKLRLFENMTDGDIAVINNDDPYREMIRTPRRAGFSFSKADIEHGAYIRDGRIIFYGEIEGEGPKVPDAAAVGKGTIEDMLAAAVVTRYLGVEPKIMEDVFLSFRVIHHRFEYAGELGGVVFIDDSKGTNVGAIDTALASVDKKAVIILGGKDKGGDFGEIIARHSGKLRKAVLIGEAAARIASEIKGITDFEYAESMMDAVTKSFDSASPGDIVLLSPGCASFDMYKSYAHRGEVFTDCVKKLKTTKRN